MLVENRIHHLRNAVTPGLGSEGPHDVDDDETADDWREKQEVAEAARPLAHIGIEDDAQSSAIEQVMHQRDQRAKSDCTEAGHHADHQGKSAQCEQIHPPLLCGAAWRGIGDELGFRGRK